MSKDSTWNPVTGCNSATPGLLLPVPVPPGINRGETYRSTPQGPRYTARARKWREEALLCIMLARTLQHHESVPEAPLTLTIERPVRDRHDLDSGLKLLLDVVAQGLGVDDRRFTVITLRRNEAVEAGWVWVRITAEQVNDTPP